MSISSEITRLQNAKSTLKTKLNAKNDEQHQITNETIDEYGDFVDSIQSSNIIGATAEGESLNLTNTKAMPYSDYVVEGKSEQEGEPSPSIPSEIHSVADDVNLFDASKTNNPTAITVSDNGETITMPIASSGNGAASTNATLKQLCPDLQVGDYIYLNFTRNLGKTYNNLIYLAGSGKEIYNASAYSFNTGTTITQQDLDSIVYLYGNRYSSGETEQCIITDFKIQKNKITPYSPYNQGTVTIKQRGKNLFDLKKFLTDRNVTYTENSDGSLAFTTASSLYLNPLQFSNEDIAVSLSGILTTLEEMSNAKIEILNNNNVVVGQINLSTSKVENISGCKLRFNMTSNKTITLKNIQLEERLTSNRLRTISRL